MSCAVFSSVDRPLRCVATLRGFAVCDYKLYAASSNFVYGFGEFGHGYCSCGGLDFFVIRIICTYIIVYLKKIILIYF